MAAGVNIFLGSYPKEELADRFPKINIPGRNSRFLIYQRRFAAPSGQESDTIRLKGKFSMTTVAQQNSLTSENPQSASAYAQVVFNLPLKEAFTYGIPEHLQGKSGQERACSLPSVPAKSPATWLA